MNDIEHKGWAMYKGWIISDGLRPYSQYQFWHEDFDGAPDSGDNRCGTAETLKSAQFQIDDMEEDS